MRDKKFLVITMGLFIVGIFIFSTMYSGFDFKLTGHAIFENDEQVEFDLGTYDNTEWNGSAVTLDSGQVSGTYTSRIFDAGSKADWNELTWEGETSIDSDSFLTSAIHEGDNATEVFVLDEIYYLADMKDSFKNIYLNFSDNLINNSVLKIYAKKDNGVTIGVYSSSDSSGTNPLETFTILSETGEWYNITLNITTLTNSIWIGEGAGSGTDPKDYFDYIYAEIPGTNLSFQIKNCSSSDCSDGTWQDADLANLNLQSRYFQYRVDFTTPDSNTSPALTSVNIDYDLLDSFPPQISFSSSTTATGEYNQENIFIDVEVADENQIYSFINFDNSLVGFWKMNDTGNVAKDYSGYGNDGAINGSGSTAGKFGGALSFDGTEVIEIQHHASISINTPYSISAWIKPSDVSGMNIITSKDEAVWEMMMLISNGGLYVGFENCADDNFLGLGGIITVDNWQHIVYIYNGSRVLGYINGVEVINADGSGTPCVSGYSLGIGDSKHGISYPFNGVIDEVLIFNRVLSSAEISALYSSSSYANNFTSLEDESYEFYSYVQDTSGNENQTETRTVNLVSNVAPSITLVEPQNILYVTNESLALDFFASDSDGNLDSCWYNLDNGKNITLENCTNTTFNVPMDGTYIINLFANDSEELEKSDSVSFNVDVTGVSVALSEPTETKSSRVNIPLIFTATGNNLICWYNLQTSIGGSVIENTTLGNCSNSSFDVSADGDYVLNLYANNTLGSSDFDSSGFSVDTSSGNTVVISSSGGGSSGGGSIIIPRVSNLATLEIEKIDVVASVGEEKNLLVNVKNAGGVSANKCSLVAGEGYEEYIDSSDLLNIGVGEIVEFMFVLNVLDEDAEELGLSVKCLENISAEVPIEIIIWKPDLDVSIVEISFKSDDKLLVAYNIEPTDNSTRSLLFKILNSDGEVVAEISKDVELIFGQLYTGEILIDISDVEEGMLKVAITDKNKVNFIEENFVYGRSPGITGFSLANLDAESSYIGIILVLFLVLTIFLVIRIWKLRK